MNKLIFCIAIILFSVTSSAQKKNSPIPVLISSFGHLWHGEDYPPAYRCIGFQTTLIRAVKWLGKGRVTYPVPANFPTENNTSLADYFKIP